MFNQRSLHPFAWWCWGICLAIATSRTGNFWSIAIIITAAMTVTYLRKSTDPWAQALTIGIKVASVALILRMAIAIIFSVPGQGKVLFTLPRIRLPEWLAGIILGGEVTQARLQFVLLESLTIFALVISIAAASSLANPKQTLRALPGILHEAGVALVIATTLIPHFATSIKRIKNARALRGDTSRFAFKKTLVPLFEETLERALILAESMESRGYGYKGKSKLSNLPTWLLFAGLLALLFSVIQLVTGSNYRLSLLSAALLLGLGLVIGNSQNSRSRYRPIPWRKNESLILISGVLLISISGARLNLLLASILFIVAITPLFLTSSEKSAT